MKTIVRERKLDFWDFINEGLKIFLFRIRDFSLLALGAIIPSSLLLVFASEDFLFQGTDANAVKIGLFFLLLIFQILVSLVVSMSAAIITENIVEDKQISLTDALELALSKWSKGFTTQLLTFLIIFGLSLLLIIPGFVYSIYYVFALYVVALRDKSGMEALNYSKTLVEGQWWRIFWILLGIGIIFGIINGLFTILFGLISDNPYFAIIPNGITLYIASMLGTINVVIFLNTDFVHHRRLEKRKEMEKARKTKRAKSIEQYLNNTKKTKPIQAKSSKTRNTKKKPEKSKTVTKRNTPTKG